MFTLIISGSLITITNKIQNNTKSLNIPFHHAWFITFLMFISELISLPLYYIIYDSKKEEDPKKEENKNKKKINIFQLLIPPLFDFIGSTLMTFGLIFLSGSIFQMFRGSLIIITFLMSLFYMKNKHNINHYFGITFTVLGLILVGFAAFMTSKDKLHNDSILGIFLILIAQFFAAFQYIYEENIMKNYICHPMQCIGYEGLFGTLISSFLIFIFYFIKCTNGKRITEQFCNLDNEGIWRVENIFFAFTQLYYNKILILLLSLYCIGITIYNITGIAVTKYTTATTRAVVDTVRTIFIWVYFLMPFNHEDVRETFNLIQFSGFILLIIGNLIYNEIIGFNTETDGNNLEQEKYYLLNQEDENEKNTVDDSENFIG
jgi:drug/metabolite transporter (DMT)-like permease